MSPDYTVRFKGDNRSLLGAARQSEEATGRLSKRVRASGGDFRHTNNEVGKLTRGALAGSGAFRGFARSIAFASSAFLGGAGISYLIKGAIAGASNLREEINKASVVFRGGATVILRWSKSAAVALGLARVEALKFAGTFGNMLVPMGFARREAARMSKNLVQLAADMASFNNASPEEVLEALRAGLAGETEPLRRFGVFLNEARVQAEAASSGLVKTNVDLGKVADAETKLAIARAKARKALADYGAGTTQVAQANLAVAAAERGIETAMKGSHTQLTAQQKAAAIYRIILKDTTDAQGDLARTSGSWANVQRRLRAALVETQTTLGQGLMPILRPLLRRFTAYVVTLQEGGKRHADFVRTIHNVVEGISTAVRVTGGMARALNRVARAMGGWDEAFKLILAGFIAARVSAIARVLLVLQARIVGTAAVAEAASLRIRAAMARTGLGILILVAAEVILHWKKVKAYLLAFGLWLDIWAVRAALKIVEPFSHLPGRFGAWARRAKVTLTKELSNMEAARAAAAASGRSIGRAWSEAFLGEAVKVKDGIPSTFGPTAVADLYKPGGQLGPRGVAGKGRRITTIARGAARQPGAGTVGFHLPGERRPYDCSAFVQAVYRQAGINIGTNTYAQVRQGRHVDRRDLRPGDLIFMNFPGERSPGHVGIYVGGGKMVHDHGASGGVEEQAVPWGNVVDTRTYVALGGPAVRPPRDEDRTTGASTAGAAAGDAADLVVGTPARRTPSTRQAAARFRQQLAFINRHLGEVLSPQLQKMLERRIASIRKLLSGVVTPRELAEAGKQMSALKRLFAKALDFSQGVRNIRSQMRRIGEQIERMPAETRGRLRNQMAALRKELENVTTQAGLTRIRKKLDAISKAIQKAIDLMIANVDKARDRLSDAFQNVMDHALEVFDAVTDEMVKAARAPFEALTPAEQALEALRRRRQETDTGRRREDAQTALARAQRLGDPAMIRDALRELADIEQEELERNLEAQAEIERAAADAAADAEEKRIRDERRARRDAFEQRAQDIIDAYSNENGLTQAGIDALLALFGEYGIDFANAGSLIGAAFAEAFRDAVTDLVDAVNDLIDAINDVNAATGHAPIPRAHPHPRRSGGHAPGGHHPPGGMARGGIVVRPTKTWVGEAGPEAVIPLARLQEVVGSLTGGGGPVYNIRVEVAQAIGSDLRKAGKELAYPIRREIHKIDARSGLSSLTVRPPGSQNLGQRRRPQ